MTIPAPTPIPKAVISDQVVAATTPWSGLVRKGQGIGIIDLEGEQAVDTLFYNAHNHAERYSAQETLAAQRSAYIGAGTKVISSEGRVMLTVTADTVGEHDTSAGACSTEANTVR